MRHILLRFTDNEFQLLEKYREGIPKQTYCKKKILDEPIDNPDFESEKVIDDNESEFYFSVHFKLSPKERDILDELRGDMTLQEFCRKSVLNQKIVNFDDLKRIKYELSKIGNNVNQIAKVGNQTGTIDKAAVDNLVEAFIQLTKGIKEVEDIIKERFN